jgi:hypothetical protein
VTAKSIYPVNETEYQLLSQTQDLWIDQNELQAQLPPETDPPLGEEDAEIADFVAEAGAFAQIRSTPTMANQKVRSLKSSLQQTPSQQQPQKR